MSRQSSDIEKNRCRVKKRYETAEEAPKVRPPLQVYACPVCEGFHITGGIPSALYEIRHLERQHKFKGMGVEKNGGRRRQSR